MEKTIIEVEKRIENGNIYKIIFYHQQYPYKHL